MAIITEEEEQKEESKLSQDTKKPSSSSKPGAAADSPTANAFKFWAFFTVAISLITFLVVSLTSLAPQDDKSWFLSLPDDARLHHSRGRTIKVLVNPNMSPIEVFAIEDGPRDAETVVIVHGLGCSSYSFRKVIRSLGSSGVRAVAIDLPGSGFSDKSAVVEDERWGGVLGKVWDVYGDIKEKGLFWGFDQLIETGQIAYQENRMQVSVPKSVKPLRLGPDEMSRVIGQVIDSMALAPVHLVLHDSALGMGANWVLENAGSISSLTLIDTASRRVAFPLWVLEVPLIRDFVLGFSSVYVRFLKSCCSRSMDGLTAEALRILLKGRDGRRAILGVGKSLNYSFDFEEWGASKVVNSLPVQVLWSSSWSEEWSGEGRLVAEAIPRAKFVEHSGGRWPQEDAADEIAEIIAQFVSSLPKSIREAKEDPIPEHIQKLLNEGNGNNHHLHQGVGHHDHHGSHDHVHEPNYMDAYGLGHGWGN